MPEEIGVTGGKKELENKFDRRTRKVCTQHILQIPSFASVARAEKETWPVLRITRSTR